MDRRDFLKTMLIAGMAPAIVHASSIMRIKPILLPGEDFEYGLVVPKNPWTITVVTNYQRIDLL